MTEPARFTLFHGVRLAACGTLADVTAAARVLDDTAPVLAFSDATGRVADLDLRPGTPAQAPRGRGRPRLGVAPREVTLLPRHWDWLTSQPGGASATLRRLVDAAIAAPPGPEAARERAYHFLQAIAGDLAGYEPALRALFRGDGAGFAQALQAMPPDIRTHALTLAAPGLAA